MWYIVFSIIALGLISAGIGIYYNKKRQRMLERGEVDLYQEPQIIEEECCGQHAVCEHDSLLAAVSKQIEYYDDEELDAFKGVDSDAFTPVMVDEFREVLYTLKEIEVAGWIRSLQLRGINLPEMLKDEVFMIVGERRS